MKGTGGRYSSARIWFAGFIVAFAMCAHYPLMYSFRRAWQSHYPQLASQWANNGRFSSIGAYGTEHMYEELGFAARARLHAEHFPAFDPYIKESRSVRQLLIDGLSYTALGMIQRVVGDISWSWILAKFLCCLFWFILVYSLALRTGESPEFAIFCATFVTCFSYMLTFLFVREFQWHGRPSTILAHDLWSTISYGRTEGILRIPRPGVAYAFGFLAALWNVKAAEGIGWKWPVLSGILGGLLAYVHFDVWTGYVGATGVFCVVYAWKNKWCWKLAAIPVIAVLIGLPLVYFIYPPSPDIMLREQFINARQFHLYSIVYLLAFVISLRYQAKPVSLFLGSMAASTFFFVNLELITGNEVAPEHWAYFGNIFVFLLAMSFVTRRMRNRSSLWLGASLVMVLAAFLQSVGYAAIHYPFSGIPKEYEDAFDWMNENTPKDSAVFALNEEVEALIPAFTHDRSFLSYINLSVSDYPSAQNGERLLRGLEILGADRQRFFKDCLFGRVLNDRRDSVATGLYRGEMEKNDLYMNYFRFTPENTTRDLLSQMKNLPMDLNPDYVWVGHMEKEYAGKDFFLKKNKTWELVYKNAAVALYRRTERPGALAARRSEVVSRP